MQSESIPMAATPSSYERVQRLPRDFAWLTVLIHAALFVASTVVQLLPMLLGNEQLRSRYAMPAVWIPMLAHAGMAWLLAATLAWSHARKALDERGAASLARVLNPGSRFALAYLVVVIANIFALSPLLYRLQLLFMPGGALQDIFDMHGMRSWMTTTMLIQSIIQLVVLVLGVWLAAWFALRKGGRVVPAAAPSDVAANEVPVTTSPRRAIALVGAAVFASLQVWSATFASHWTDAVRLMDSTALLLGWIVLPLLSFALAFWGGWLGADPGLTQVRPFRAVAASVFAFVLAQVICIAAGLAWLMLAIQFSSVLGSVGGLLGFVVAFVVLYMALAVLLMRAAMRRQYRRYL